MQRAHRMCIRILLGISYFMLGQNIIFSWSISIFHDFWHFYRFLWLLKAWLEIIHSNSMTFPGFPWPHEACVNDQKVNSYSHACMWLMLTGYDDLTILHNRFSKWFTRYQHKMTWLIILKWKKQNSWLYAVILGSNSAIFRDCNFQCFLWFYAMFFEECNV